MSFPAEKGAGGRDLREGAMRDPLGRARVAWHAEQRRSRVADSEGHQTG